MASVDVELPSTWVRFGRVARAHGVRGEVRVAPDDPSVPFPEKSKIVRLRGRNGTCRTVEVERVRPIHEALLLTLSEVPSREAAQALAGSVLEVETAALEPSEPSEPYVYELTGAAVLDADSGAEIGTVAAVLDNAGQCLLAIDSPDGERLLPLVPDTFVGFDREQARLFVKVPLGLWE